MTEEKDHFRLNRIFTNTSTILRREEKSVEDIFKTSIFVLDTNSLLAPFQTGKDDIEKIRKIYEKLISENRLYIPEHVIKEFAENRSSKISDLYTNIDNSISSLPSLKAFEYPILGELESYKALKETRESILELVRKYKEHLVDLKVGVTNWNWSDPVTLMYSKTFPENSILKITVGDDELISEYNDRIKFNMPPGNKDKSKPTNAIGDFVIWKTILELGKKEKKDIVFISNDEKNDWVLKGNQKTISTKYELVHEFYEETNGNNFLCMTFASFMEAQGVEINFVENFNYEEIIGMPIPEEEKTGTFESLRLIYNDISTFINNLKTDNETNYIEGNISEYIKHFKAAFRNEFYNTTDWQLFSSFFYKFSDWLTKIDSYNFEIYYQEVRMKRSTDTQRFLMIALAKEFISHYELFTIL